MSTRLEKVNEEIKRIEKRIALQQDQLKGALQRRKMIENEEIVRSFRSLNLDHGDLAVVIRGLQSGGIGVDDIKKLAAVQGNSSEKEQEIQREEIPDEETANTDDLSEAIIDVRGSGSEQSEEALEPEFGNEEDISNTSESEDASE